MAGPPSGRSVARRCACASQHHLQRRAVTAKRGRAIAHQRRTMHHGDDARFKCRSLSSPVAVCGVHGIESWNGPRCPASKSAIAFARTSSATSAGLPRCGSRSEANSTRSVASNSNDDSQWHSSSGVVPWPQWQAARPGARSADSIGLRYNYPPPARRNLRFERRRSTAM